MLIRDADLLRWEPCLAVEAAAAAQVLFSGRADLMGDRADLDRADAHPCWVGRAAVIDGDETRIILAVESPTRIWLTSALPGNVARRASLVVRTFEAQRRIAADQARRALDDIRGDTRRVAVLSALHLIYSGLAAVAPDGQEADPTVRRELYERLLRGAIGRDDDHGDRGDDNEPVGPGRPRRASADYGD